MRDPDLSFVDKIDDGHSDTVRQSSELVGERDSDEPLQNRRRPEPREPEETTDPDRKPWQFDVRPVVDGAPSSSNPTTPYQFLQLVFK